MIRKIKNFLESLEDPKYPLLGPNLWALKKLGFILPENKWKKVGHILFHQWAVFFVITQFIELYIIKSNLDDVLSNLKISMLSIVCIVKSNTFVYWQKKWIEVINYITEADRYERETRDEVRGRIIDSYTKYCRKVTFSYWFLVLLTFTICAMTPPIRYLSAPVLREGIRNGTEPFLHIFSSWVPFDKNHFPGNWVTVASHMVIGYYGTINMSSYDSNIVTMMVFFAGHFEILRERCKVMFGPPGEPVSHQEALENIRRIYIMHINLTKYFRLFNSLFSPVMFLYVFINSLMLCASTYQLTDAPDPFQKFLMAEFLFFGIAQLFVFCWHSDIALLNSEDSAYGPYESEWWAVSVPLQKVVVLLEGQFRIVHQFTAGPFTNLTLSTFITILKGSYSYYTLIKK